MNLSSQHKIQTNEGHPRISVVICTLNEEGNLPKVLPRIPDWVDEIILVDGHSTDNTVLRCEKYTPEYSNIISAGAREKTMP